MKKVLITGANGYIGKCLFHFLKKKFNIIGIDKEKSPEKKIFQCNLLNNKELDRIIKKEKPDTIKGELIKSAFLTSTMGISYKVGAK